MLRQTANQAECPRDGAQSPSVDLTIVIVSFNTAYLLPRLFSCILAASSGVSSQTIVVDNRSTDDTVSIIKKDYPWVELIENPSNVGFGRANNQALPLARGRYVLLLNTDAFIEPHALSSTVMFMDSNPEIGLLGVKLVSENGDLQPSCRYFPTPWNTFLQSTGLHRFFPKVQMVDDYSWDHNSPRFCDWVPGCFYLIRREVIDQVGLFDERYFLYFEEVDHCRSVKAAGWKVAYYPDTKVIHIGGESAQSHGRLTKATRQISSLQIESELLYHRKHYGLIGVAASFGLSLTDFILKVGAAILRHRNLRHAEATFDRLKKILASLLRTKLGSHPTR
jgi:N-acetylglucosaminyl-diphospho-decaprenol L-rhamnosyltransferase